MKHKATAHYPASMAAVLRMFTTPEYHTAKLEKLGVKHKVLEQKTEGNEFSITVERQMPVKLPGTKKGGGGITNIESWNRETGKGHVDVHTPGMPLEMNCESEMADDGDGCTITYHWNVNSSVPLVGKKIEKFVVEDMDRRFAEETKVGISLLETYGK